jgi:hypothetical protein
MGGMNPEEILKNMTPEQRTQFEEMVKNGGVGGAEGTGCDELD